MIFKLWRAMQRRTDMQLLWPVCRDEAPTLDHAKAAFMLHVANDTAWTKDYTHDQLVTYVDGLS